MLSIFVAEMQKCMQKECKNRLEEKLAREYMMADRCLKCLECLELVCVRMKLLACSAMFCGS